MNGDPFGRVVPGQIWQPQARTINAFVEAVHRSRSDRNGLTAELPPPDQNPGTILVQNQTGHPQARFNVLALGDPLITPDQNEVEALRRIVMGGLTPGAVNDTIAILQEPLAPGRIGRAVISGASWVRLAVESDLDNTAGPVPGQTGYLSTGSGLGSPLVWFRGGSGSGSGALDSGRVTEWGIVLVNNCLCSPFVPSGSGSGDSGSGDGSGSGNSGSGGDWSGDGGGPPVVTFCSGIGVAPNLFGTIHSTCPCLDGMHLPFAVQNSGNPICVNPGCTPTDPLDRYEWQANVQECGPGGSNFQTWYLRCYRGGGGGPYWRLSTATEACTLLSETAPTSVSYAPLAMVFPTTALPGNPSCPGCNSSQTFSVHILD